MSTSQRWTIGPFGRVEGDLQLHLEIHQQQVVSAQVSASLYRGFEPLLRGKHPSDALVYTPRVCGICSIAQSSATAKALADAQGLTMPPNGELATNLMLACENLADHLSHFYLFFMPDFARSTYRHQPWYSHIAPDFAAVHGQAARELLAARARFLHILGLLAGKWPHSLAIQPGGTRRAISVSDQASISASLFEFRRFLEQRLFNDSLETIAALPSAQALSHWQQQKPWQQGDFRRFLWLAQQLNLYQLGRSPGRFMSYGAYPQEGTYAFAPGVWDGKAEPIDSRHIREDLSHAWLTRGTGPQHPFEGITQPDLDAPDAYSWCKAPRLNGRVMEVGALARAQIQGHPLIRDLVAANGSNVASRVIARLLELALVLPLMEQWTAQLTPGEPFCLTHPIPDEAQGVGLIEAARGSLGHWLRIKKGRILNYQIIAPTTWNFSPRDHQGTPGPLEQALQGTPANEPTAVTIQHILRSFDPCMSCTLH